MIGNRLFKPRYHPNWKRGVIVPEHLRGIRFTRREERKYLRFRIRWARRGWRSNLFGTGGSRIEWHHWQQREAIIRCMVARGITEADVRDVWCPFNQDVYVIRTWNHRRFTIDGWEVLHDIF